MRKRHATGQSSIVHDSGALWLSLSYVSSYSLELRLTSFEDALEPANDPTPALPCNNGLPLPPDAIALYFGNSRLSTPEFRFPWPVLYPQDRRLRKKHPIITLEKDKAGRIAIDFDVLSADH